MGHAAGVPKSTGGVIAHGGGDWGREGNGLTVQVCVFCASAGGLSSCLDSHGRRDVGEVSRYGGWRETRRECEMLRGAVSDYMAAAAGSTLTEAQGTQQREGARRMRSTAEAGDADLELDSRWYV